MCSDVTADLGARRYFSGYESGKCISRDKNRRNERKSYVYENFSAKFVTPMILIVEIARLHLDHANLTFQIKFEAGIYFL